MAAPMNLNIALVTELDAIASQPHQDKKNDAEDDEDERPAPSRLSSAQTALVAAAAAAEKQKQQASILSGGALGSNAPAAAGSFVNNGPKFFPPPPAEMTEEQALKIVEKSATCMEMRDQWKARMGRVLADKKGIDGAMHTLKLHTAASTCPRAMKHDIKLTLGSEAKESELAEAQAINRKAEQDQLALIVRIRSREQKRATEAVSNILEQELQRLTDHAAQAQSGMTAVTLQKIKEQNEAMRLLVQEDMVEMTNAHIAAVRKYLEERQKKYDMQIAADKLVKGNPQQSTLNIVDQRINSEMVLLRQQNQEFKEQLRALALKHGDSSVSEQKNEQQPSHRGWVPRQQQYSQQHQYQRNNWGWNNAQRGRQHGYSRQPPQSGVRHDAHKGEAEKEEQESPPQAREAPATAAAESAQSRSQGHRSESVRHRDRAPAEKRKSRSREKSQSPARKRERREKSVSLSPPRKRDDKVRSHSRKGAEEQGQESRSRKRDRSPAPAQSRRSPSQHLSPQPQRHSRDEDVRSPSPASAGKAHRADKNSHPSAKPQQRESLGSAAHSAASSSRSGRKPSGGFRA
jgi:hypothetical protein